jgi:circadian clock protein KaiB
MSIEGHTPDVRGERGMTVPPPPGPGGRETYVLRLYVAGIDHHTRRTLENIRNVCDAELAGRYELEVVDLYQQPERTVEAQVVWAPTLVKELPPPLRRMIGDLSQSGKLLVAVDLRSGAEARDGPP